MPPEPLQTYVGGGDFVQIGKDFCDLFQRLGGLTPSDDVLDMGCGSGRMAIPLTGFLGSGARYEGFDISAESIAWCKKHITGAHPRFGFRHVDIANTHYNPGGQLTSEGFTFPYDDASFDFAFATSLFTHMLPAGLDRYATETARVLRPGGRLFATAFVWNADTSARAESGKLRVDFPLDFGSYRTASDDLEAVVAYDEQDLLRRLQAGGLRQIGEVHTGNWTGRNIGCPTFQDVIVLERPAA